MIFVFQDKEIREQFEKELEGAAICRRADSDVFGSDVSSEDYVERALTGASIYFYKDIFRKRVAQSAIDNDHVILDCDPHIPDDVKKCPVIYITDRTEGNDEEFGQLPVKYAGSVRATVKASAETLQYWIDKYGEGRSEKDFYKDFLEASTKRIPDKIRLIGAERLHGTYVAGAIADFDESKISAIEKCIRDTKKEGYAVFVDARTDCGFFNIEDIYYDVIWADSPEDFINVCNTLEARNDKHYQDLQALDKAIKENCETWEKEIYNNILLKHREEVRQDWHKKSKRIPSGYIQIYYEETYQELHLEKLRIIVSYDEVAFLKKVLDYLKEELERILDGTVRLDMYFYDDYTLEGLLNPD